jgi:uncharacterized protein YegP (UPF0339 family)
MKKTTKKTKITPYIDASGEYRWTMTAPNGEKIADSAEGYKTKQGVNGAIKRLVGSKFVVGKFVPPAVAVAFVEPVVTPTEPVLEPTV